MQKSYVDAALVSRAFKTLDNQKPGEEDSTDINSLRAFRVRVLTRDGGRGELAPNGGKSDARRQ